MWDLLGKILPGLLFVVVLVIYYIARSRTPNKTVLQRLNEWDARLDRLVTVDVLSNWVGVQTAINEQIGRLHNVTSEQVMELAKDRTKAITERSELHTGIADLTRKVNSCEDAFHVLPRFISAWSDFTQLVREASEAIDTFLRLRNMYGTAAPFVGRPFSGWRLTNQTFEHAPSDTLEAEKWARSLSDHMQHLEHYYASYTSEARSPLFASLLCELVRTWIVNNSDITGDRLLELLYEHRVKLIELRRTYATSASVGALVKATIS
jgi:hypothetical protein